MGSAFLPTRANGPISDWDEGVDLIHVKMRRDTHRAKARALKAEANASGFVRQQKLPANSVRRVLQGEICTGAARVCVYVCTCLLACCTVFM